jgi:alkylation response protein AidB-like acyl-CoA dehydrogenase
MLSLTAEQQMLVDTLEQLAEREFADRAFEWDGTPWANVELLADQGFLGINIDEEYGGGGMSELEALLSIDIVGRVCPHTANFLYTQQVVAPRAIEMFGTAAAKERYLPPVTAGEDLIAIAISEPEAGSDVKSMNTTITEEDGELVMNGEKIWVSNVREASASVVWTKFEGEGLGSVVVDLDDPGIGIQTHFTNMFGEEQTQFHIEDVVVPEENVLTRGADAFKAQLEALNWERLGSSAIANALAANALDKALDYGAQREQFGQPIGEFQGIEWKFADMVTQLHASQALTYGAAQRAVQQGRIPDRLHTSIAKLFSAEMVEDVVSEALQIHGANGYQQGHPMEFLYRMARARRIAAGTDEMQRNTIAYSVKKDGFGWLLD